MKHIYICTSYPSFSETFVGIEMLSLIARGEDVFVYSLRVPPPGITPEVSCLAQPRGLVAIALWSVPGSLLLARSVMKGMRFRRKSFTRLLFAAAHAARLSRAIARRRFDAADDIVVHAHFLDRPADVALLLPGRQFVRTVTVHAGDAWASEDPSLRRWRIGAFDHIICASEYARRGVASNRTDSVSVIHCGVVVPARPVGRPTHDASRVRVCTLARLVPKKNHAYVAKVLDEVEVLGTAVEWHVVGDGPLMGWLENRVAAMRVPRRNVILHGALPHSEALGILRASDVMLLPSSDAPPGPDGIPVALIEAMATGVLAVSTDVGGIAELVIDGKTGLLVDPNDASGCARSLVALLSAPADLRSLLDAAYVHVADSFNAANSAQQLLDLTIALAAHRRHVMGPRRS